MRWSHHSQWKKKIYLGKKYYLPGCSGSSILTLVPSTLLFDCNFTDGFDFLFCSERVTRQLIRIIRSQHLFQASQKLDQLNVLQLSNQHSTSQWQHNLIPPSQWQNDLIAPSQWGHNFNCLTQLHLPLFSFIFPVSIPHFPKFAPSFHFQNPSYSIFPSIAIWNSQFLFYNNHVAPVQS